jgi:site-specific DNA recombinase
MTKELAMSPKRSPLLLPNLATIYYTDLSHPYRCHRGAVPRRRGGREEFEMLRCLNEEVRIVPEEGQYRLELKGELAGILALAQGAKNSEGAPAQRALQIKVVAEARIQRNYNAAFLTAA